MNKHVCIAVLVGVVFVVFCRISTADTISLAPTLTSVTLGAPVTLNVNVSGVPDLFAFQFDIAFDPAMLAVANVTEGALFSSSGVGFFPGIIDNTAGSLTFVSDTLSGPGPGISTDGTLATIAFNTLGSGTTTVALDNVFLLDSTLDDIIVTASSASVTITGAATVPEPSTLTVFAGLLCVGMAMIKRQLRGYPTGHERSSPGSRLPTDGSSHRPDNAGMSTAVRHQSNKIGNPRGIIRKAA